MELTPSQDSTLTPRMILQMELSTTHPKQPLSEQTRGKPTVLKDKGSTEPGALLLLQLSVHCQLCWGLCCAPAGTDTRTQQCQERSALLTLTAEHRTRGQNIHSHSTTQQYPLLHLAKYLFIINPSQSGWSQRINSSYMFGL